MSVAASLAATHEAATQVLADGNGFGIQLAIIQGGTDTHAVWGTASCGSPMSEDQLHPAYCATKPLLAIGVGHLITIGDLALDTRPVEVIGDRLPCPADVTVADLLAHRTGLRNPTAFQWWLSDDTIKQALLTDPPQGPAPAYSEILAWLILEQTVETLTGTSAAEFVTSQVLDPLGLESEFIIDAGQLEHPDTLARLRVPIGGTHERPLPLLFELLDSQLAKAGPTFGGWVTARGLARFYQAIGTAMAGEPVPGLPEPGTLQALLSTRRADYDDFLGHYAAFAGGFMTDLAMAGVGDVISGRAIGHAAAIGNVVGFIDPEADLAVGMYINGACNEQAVLNHVRSTLTTALYRDLGLT